MSCVARVSAQKLIHFLTAGAFNPVSQSINLFEIWPLLALFQLICVLKTRVCYKRYGSGSGSDMVTPYSDHRGDIINCGLYAQIQQCQEFSFCQNDKDNGAVSNTTTFFFYVLFFVYITCTGKCRDYLTTRHRCQKQDSSKTNKNKRVPFDLIQFNSGMISKPENVTDAKSTYNIQAEGKSMFSNFYNKKYTIAQSLQIWKERYLYQYSYHLFNNWKRAIYFFNGANSFP